MKRCFQEVLGLPVETMVDLTGRKVTMPVVVKKDPALLFFSKWDYDY
jgi:hypothetical protein